MLHFMIRLFCATGIVFASFGLFYPSIATEVVPHIGNKGQNHYNGKYKNSQNHKAFVIAPGGRWQWKSKKQSADKALKDALAKCAKQSDYCIPYNVDGELVFNKESWASVLAPYPTIAEMESAATGAKTGNVFPDLSFTSKSGEENFISDYKGKFVIVNIWASWCPGCLTEMPSLQKLYDEYKDNPDVQFITIATMEASSKSYKFVEGKGFSFPVFHTGITSKKNRTLPLKSGEETSLDKLGKYVPNTIILNKRGQVIFHRIGEFNYWDQFTPQMEHILKNAG